MAIIGRDAGATVEIDDERISRQHVRLEPRRDGWQAFDTSTNGIFVDGIRRNSVLITGTTTLHLGAPDGVAVLVTPQHPSAAAQEESTRIVAPFQSEDEPWWEQEIDPGVVRAGSAVAERRQELGIAQRSLARDGIINAGALINFEKGRSWPRRSTLEKLERVLEWPTGHITRIRRAAVAEATTPIRPPAPVAAAGEEATEVFTNSVQAPLMAETVELAMHTITTAVSELPEPTDPDFTRKATNILADLRRLERLASNAARNAKGSPSVILALSSVRRSYNDLMMRAAQSPAATLGQRLYGARQRAELSIEEAANGAGLPATVLEDAEAERPIAPDAARALENLVGQLTIS
ncbi:hypothetical protein BZL29_7980 [Mycobacterium kansasii]|uniref:FHA domain-containing protein n=1 Tax=Mycobacterium kansasii TaxID=1768 RepID=A0A1V3WEL5_MYCKA|nr:hypothetical protein BZL29_7980 [Mycobacterium kansasii]